MIQQKAVLPSLREKKRYLAFEVISEGRISDAGSVEASIRHAALSYLGSKGSSAAGIIMLKEKYNVEKQRGLLRVGHKHLDPLRAALCFITRIEDNKAIVHSLGASGMVNKAYKYVAG